jgi:uncharacterized membrane-anchored protein
MQNNQHPDRQRILSELHLRPSYKITGEKKLKHRTFLRDDKNFAAFFAALNEQLIKQGFETYQAGESHYFIKMATTRVRIEIYGEFIAVTVVDNSDDISSFKFENLPLLGKLIAAIQIKILNNVPTMEQEAKNHFRDSSLIISHIMSGGAQVFTDLREKNEGNIEIWVNNLTLSPRLLGVSVQRILEIESYRMMALLGLIEAQNIAPILRRLEQELPTLIERSQNLTGLSENKLILDELVNMAVETETLAASTQFRFGATRAYNELIRLRLLAIEEKKAYDFPTFTSFLSRRLDPAIRTCLTTDDRLANLSRKLARAAQLIRARVDVILAQQNQELLNSMNQRAHLQLQLQQTVEGLSIAALSYYIVGLVGYVTKSAKDLGVIDSLTLINAISVPVIVAGVWMMVRRIRKKHS